MTNKNDIRVFSHGRRWKTTWLERHVVKEKEAVKTKIPRDSMQMTCLLFPNVETTWLEITCGQRKQEADVQKI